MARAKCGPSISKSRLTFKYVPSAVILLHLKKELFPISISAGTIFPSRYFPSTKEYGDDSSEPNRIARRQTRARENILLLLGYTIRTVLTSTKVQSVFCRFCKHKCGHSLSVGSFSPSARRLLCYSSASSNCPSWSLSLLVAPFG